MINQYPLSWPGGWKRSPEVLWSRFTSGSAYSESRSLVRQLELMGATDIVISSNLRYRSDGIPYAQQGRLADIGSKTNGALRSFRLLTVGYFGNVRSS